MHDSRYWFRKEDTGSSVYDKIWYPGTRLTIYKISKIFLIQPSKSDLVTVEMDGLSPAFRKWSIIAFALESIAVILTFLFMVFFLKREINVTMMYILLLVMAISAVLLIITGRPATEK